MNEHSESTQPDAHGSPSIDDRDDVLGACIAIVRAALSGDHEGAEAVATTVDTADALACMTGLASSWGMVAYRGPARFATALGEWRPGQKLGRQEGPVDHNANLDIYPDAEDLRGLLSKLDRARLEPLARWVMRRLEGDLE